MPKFLTGEAQALDKHRDSKQEAIFLSLSKLAVSLRAALPPSHSYFKHPLRLAVMFLLASSIVPSVVSAQGVPVFKISAADSTINFSVKASVPLDGHFDKWDAALVFTSPDVTTGVLSVNIHAASVDTGSGMKDGKLKSKDFFDVHGQPDNHLYIQQDYADWAHHLRC